MTIKALSLVAVVAPLLGALIAGLGAKKIGKRGAHSVTIALMIISFCCSAILFKRVTLDHAYFNGTIYSWASSPAFQFNIGFLIDQLTVVMMMVVTTISLVVHIYSIGYMAGDPGYQRFFSYISLFTFAMLMLVTANNFLQVFFGWEGVGLVSYLLIGFWFTKESAARGSLKAFLVNRVGDFGFILGISAIFVYFGTLDYSTVFETAGKLQATTISIFPGSNWSILTVIGILLFIGAMGKSAQMPLHVWLPESMEGPTPISALIHAATMVTAGVFLLARISPLLEWSPTALNVVLIIGATTALFTGLLAFVEFDIKRVIAFSTMSQLGYMIAADGASAYSAGIFHLLTHACFKALLFLAAGSVIIAMHHEQDMRKMGNLKKYLPITYAFFLIGSLSLSAIPPFSGFYSKDSIIEAVRLSNLSGAGYAYACLVISAFVTAYYIFRAFFMTFHTKERMPESLQRSLKETSWFMQVPIWILGVLATIIGGLLVKWMLYSHPTLLGHSITVFPQYDVLSEMYDKFQGVWHMTYDAVFTAPFWAAILGIFFAWFTVIAIPQSRDILSRYLPIIRKILIGQYGFDRFNQLIFVKGFRRLGDCFFKVGDLKVLDHFMVDGSGRGVNRIARWIQRLQTGYLYHYVLAMIVGLLIFLIWFVLV